MNLPIEAEGSLLIGAPAGRELRVVARGNAISVELTDWQTLSSLGPRSLRGQRNAIARVARTLAMFDLSVRVGLAGRPAVTMGAGASPSIVARLFGLGPVQIPFAALPGILNGL